MSIELDTSLRWRDLAAVAAGAELRLADAAWRRLARGRAIVDALIECGILTYGVNTGVGALSDTLVGPDQRRALSRNILLSHAVGVGPRLRRLEVRAIMTAQVNNFAHGHSGVREVVVAQMLGLLSRGATPVVPAQGSVGYLSHAASIGLVLIGEGSAEIDGEVVTGREALRRCGLAPLVLEAKEGLSLVNGSPCATGLAALALRRAEALLAWADVIGAFSVESLGGQIAAFDARSMALHRSPGLNLVAERLRRVLAGSSRIAEREGARTQDALSLRAIPQVHGAARDAFDYVAGVIERELGSVTDNPLVLGSPEAPEVRMEAHAVAAGVGLGLDTLAIAIAEVAAMAERRIDRLVNPLVSTLPPFLAGPGGMRSGFMIAQYTAASLVAENRRLAAPASLDGGITSGLQEDHLAHATPASLKALQIAENLAQILAIELLCAAQASDCLARPGRGAGTDALYRRLRARVSAYADDRPLGPDLAAAKLLLDEDAP